MENRCLPLKLPREGDSLVVETKVKPLFSKICKLEIVISLAVELEVIQRCEIEVSTIDTIAPVTLAHFQQHDGIIEAAVCTTSPHSQLIVEQEFSGFCWAKLFG